MTLETLLSQHIPNISSNVPDILKVVEEWILVNRVEEKTFPFVMESGAYRVCREEQCRTYLEKLK